ncbi:MAG: ketol-acid reductoisomerase [Thaumarchaeota archaeon]|nr:ketol-acid reductoisomerase [Nitrososphaerota archaeon]
MVKIWKDNDVSLDIIKNQTIGIIGYGIQGKAQANNMKDSGLNVIIGLNENGNSWKVAKKHGHVVMSIEKACEQSDIIHILIPDMVQADVYNNKIINNIQNGNALSFSHGAAIHCKWINPPKNADIIMIAPKGPGSKVRETYLNGFGTPSIIAVEQDYTNTAWDRALAISKAIGSTKVGVIRTSFQEEVETDWFGEQADLCGGTASMIINAFETLVEEGYQPEIVYFEVLHELKLIVDMIQRYGIVGMYKRVSETARFGGLTRGPLIMNQANKQQMKLVLKMIKDGTFNDEWVSQYKKYGHDSFDEHLSKIENHQVELVGKKIRKMIWG